nr:(deoxy)nucleoside triphosphate pyrophosphohydrolase [uncultured Ruminococcus sp.]
MVEVVAALIWDGNRFLICQRPEHKARGLLWEYVGGKVEPGETKQEALIRECKEELDVTITVGDVFMDVVHEYPDITVHLTLFHARIASGEIKLLEHNAVAWITPDEIPNYAFCPADKEINERIAAEYGNTLFHTGDNG